jgi:hypothetical protein
MNPWEPMWLYLLYDRFDRLLYVGITCDVGRRMAEHAEDKAWWPEVARKRIVSVRPRPGETPRLAAERLERLTIRAERPLYNIVHNGRSTRPVLTRAPRRPVSQRRRARTVRRARRGSPVRPMLWALAGGTALWCSPTYHWTAALAVALFALALRSAARRRRYT